MSKYKYSMGQFLIDVKPPPTDADLEALIDIYPSYKMSHRMPIIQAIADYGSIEQILEGKLAANGVLTPVKQSKGGNTTWATKKLRRAAIRICYLRFVINDGFTRRKANAALLKKFGTNKGAQDGGQSNIRKSTQNDQGF